MAEGYSSSELLSKEEADSLHLLLQGISASPDLKERYALRMFELGHDPKRQRDILEELAQKFDRLVWNPDCKGLLVSHHTAI